MDKDPSLLLSLPVPTDAEWNRCLNELNRACGEDASNAWHSLGQYQFHLHNLGLHTPLAQYVAEIRDVVREHAVPSEYLIQHSKFLPWPSRLVRYVFHDMDPDVFIRRLSANRELVVAQHARRCQMVLWIISQRWPLHAHLLPAADMALKEVRSALRLEIADWFLSHDPNGGEPRTSSAQDLFIALFKWNGPNSQKWLSKSGESSPLRGLAMRDLYLVEAWSKLEIARKALAQSGSGLEDVLAAGNALSASEEALRLAGCPIYGEPTTTYEKADRGEAYVVRFNYPPELSTPPAQDSK
ncbi:MAG TPA: hypothetical protein V6D08_08220 [Candidatus Obscuribacterales bacterium]